MVEERSIIKLTWQVSINLISVMQWVIRKFLKIQLVFTIRSPVASINPMTNHCSYTNNSLFIYYLFNK